MVALLPNWEDFVCGESVPSLYNTLQRRFRLTWMILSTVIYCGAFEPSIQTDRDEGHPFIHPFIHSYTQMGILGFLCPVQTHEPPAATSQLLGL